MQNALSRSVIAFLFMIFAILPLSAQKQDIDPNIISGSVKTEIQTDKNLTTSFFNLNYQNYKITGIYKATMKISVTGTDWNFTANLLINNVPLMVKGKGIILEGSANDKKTIITEDLEATFNNTVIKGQMTDDTKDITLDYLFGEKKVSGSLPGNVSGGTYSLQFGNMKVTGTLKVSNQNASNYTFTYNLKLGEKAVTGSRTMTIIKSGVRLEVNYNIDAPQLTKEEVVFLLIFIFGLN
jgi:spore coat protein U-like protein